MKIVTNIGFVVTALVVVLALALLAFGNAHDQEQAIFLIGFSVVIFFGSCVISLLTQIRDRISSPPVQ